MSVPVRAAACSRGASRAWALSTQWASWALVSGRAAPASAWARTTASSQASQSVIGDQASGSTPAGTTVVPEGSQYQQRPSVTIHLVRQL